jgi:ABC-type Na+ efflux pump permease subunit
VIRGAWFVATRDLALALRQKETLLWTFLMPILFFYFISTVNRGFGGTGEEARPLALRAGEDAGALVDALEARLAERDLEVLHEGELERPFEEYARRLELPAGFTRRVLAGEETVVRFHGDAEGLGSELDLFSVRRAVYTTLADVVALRAERGDGELGGEALLAGIDALHAAPRALSVEVSSAGRREEIPRAADQAIPGTMVMFTMLLLLTSGATGLLVERRQGLLRRLASAPMSRSTVVLGKWAGKLALGLVQIGYAMVVGTLLFGVDWGPNLPAVLLVMVVYAGFMASLALVLGSVARTEGQAVALGVLSANVFAALGGCWWPIEVVGPTMRKVAMLLPTGWAMDALHALVNFGHSGADVLPNLAALLAGAALLGALGVRVFRFE